MSSELPSFTYHSDPVASGVIETSETECVVCATARGYIYTGPVYAVEDLDDLICPWCIADGSAAKKYNATFADDRGTPDEVPEAVVDEISTRTPSFHAWQRDHWLHHCNDGAVFLRVVGSPEIHDFPGAVDAIRAEGAANEWDADAVEEYIAVLQADGDPQAYLFRCRHCGVHLAYSDFS